MLGFAERAVVILPQYDIYDSFAPTYRGRFRKAVEDLPLVFKEHFGMEVFVCSTNTLPDVNYSNYKIAESLKSADYAILKEYDVSGSPTFYDFDLGITDVDEESRSIYKKFPFKRGADLDTKLESLLNRERLMVKCIADNLFDVIVTFENLNKSYYKIKPGASDNKIFLTVDYKNLQVSGYMSGKQVQIIYLTGKAFTSLTLDSWGGRHD